MMNVTRTCVLYLSAAGFNWQNCRYLQGMDSRTCRIENALSSEESIVNNITLAIADGYAIYCSIA